MCIVELEHCNETALCTFDAEVRSTIRLSIHQDSSFAFASQKPCLHINGCQSLQNAIDSKARFTAFFTAFSETPPNFTTESISLLLKWLGLNREATLPVMRGNTSDWLNILTL